jgi:PAS domain S-box-containing protein
MNEAQKLSSPLAAPPPVAPARDTRFKLARFVSAVVAVGIGVVIAVMFALNTQTTTNTLLRQGTAQNIALGRALANAFWARYAGLVMRAHTLPPAAIVDQIENAHLRGDIYRLTRELKIVKIRIISPRGQTIFSSWDDEIGKIRTADKGLNKARAGEAHSVLALKPRFEGIDGTVRDRHIIETYLPVYHPESGAREGVMEIYADVSEEINVARRDQLLTAAALALCMLALYVFLMLAVRRAERIMNEQQRTIAESARNARLLARVVEQSRDAIITHDLNGIVTTWNNGAETIFGFSPLQAVGRSMRDMSLRDWDDIQWGAWLKRLRTGASQTIRGWRRTKSGDRVHIVGSTGPLTDENGRLVGDIAVYHDTTWLKRTQEELRRAKEAAEAAARAKSDFLANMSHEIRTPMNGIIGMTSLALETPLNAEQRDYLTTVKSSADALLQIINDILDLSKIEAGKLGIEKIGFNLRDSLQQTVRVLAVRAHEKRLELIWSVDAAVPDALIGDPLRVRQILLNLVGNAIKFTDEGEVEIMVELEDVREREVQLRFRVRDTGIGIPADKLDAVFDAFEQADTSTTRQFGGTGLGLSICRRLVNLMGGEISVRSEPGAGSAFEFSLCVGMQETQPLAEDAAAFSPADTFSRRPVLVVEDNARCRELLCAYLQSWGMQPQAVDSAAAALAQIATARAAGRPYPLVLVDGTLPAVDAFRFTAENANAQTAVLMLVDTTQGPALARAREQNRVHALVKPVSQSTLHDSLAVLLNPELADREKSVSVVAASGVPETTTPGLEVLLVEDNAVNRKLASRLLERMGHRVSEAHNGAIAVAMTAERAYDLVLMDMQMPVMDGREATQIIRARARAGDGVRVPIIALTANAMSGDRERCLEAGMDDYVSKPIEVTALTAAINRVIGGRHAETAAPAAPVAAINDQVATAATVEQVYNRREALARTCDDTELLAQIIDIFIEETPALMTQLAGFLDNGDCAGAFSAAHAIKGSSGNLSAGKASTAARCVEQAARAGDLTGARAALPALRLAVTELLAILAGERAAAPAALTCGATT